MSADLVDLTKGVGYCPQNNVLMNKITVRENLEFYGRYKKMPNLDTSINYLMEQFEMTQFANSFAETLSTGQQRRL
jgi:ABC-type multidrug transport system ATPase subunit